MFSLTAEGSYQLLSGHIGHGLLVQQGVGVGTSVYQVNRIGKRKKVVAALRFMIFQLLNETLAPPIQRETL
ncbi:hypothetical protein [Pseudomonas syringae]|uniref:hypothetical protein n=1 Tax=Pseudomonas syringae TaxID=317 RepID=UPI0006A93767|nr:hypothetical protein [Pseudomonas syringae]NYS41939.1 hypothetical protein [Pseudomonas syringae pv. actinidiae]GAO93547.1 hypothetical protein PSA5_12540 [Pseudomonas syringae pv. actinidiae]